MNTQLTTERRHQHPPQHPHEPASTQPRRHVRLADRVALHLGLALITWSRRPTPQRHERRVTDAELLLLHRERQQALASLRQSPSDAHHPTTIARLP